jgi:hypothetical protein
MNICSGHFFLAAKHLNLSPVLIGESSHLLGQSLSPTTDAENTRNSFSVRRNLGLGQANQTLPHQTLNLKPVMPKRT